MTKESRQRAARLLADAWLAGATIDLPAALLAADRAAAYAIQDEIARLLAADPANAVAGWKVGATSAGVQKAEGYDGPIPGRVFASMVYASEAELPPSALLKRRNRSGDRLPLRGRAAYGRQATHMDKPGRLRGASAGVRHHGYTLLAALPNRLGRSSENAGRHRR